MFSFFTSSALPSVMLAVLSSLAAVDALCLPCQVGLGQTPLSLKTPSSPLSRRGVYSPPITSPDASTRWVRGTEVTVTWSTSNMPQSVTNPKGTLLLGYLEEGSSNEHLDLDHPLAEGFDIRDGHRTIRVPDAATPRDNYIVVLMGDSGNASPKFTIV
ncbi:hypothetical protein B0H14DRAFT_82454 [Mycena olivaceomarginata]|uniref:Uncharacterized protein n=1 Tax=Mycena albidolilacea TaxID=1033008 RepID=A0AAD7F5X1_9AGAR|nr:hypothetical protein DFH08DRAFT_836548 [Mycena albidolilacea]KAJ7796179.1 hypothetical protein B0H14DRAFT_82454 [Mycena olivaceomarginata]